MLPFEPEYTRVLRARFPDAVDRVYNYAKGIPNPIPSLTRRHVFDCYDGMRLIITKEWFPDGPRIHVSCAYLRHRPHFTVYSDRTEGWEPVKAKMVERIAEICGDDKEFQFFGFTNDKLVPHFFYPPVPIPPRLIF